MSPGLAGRLIREKSYMIRSSYTKESILCPGDDTVATYRDDQSRAKS